VGYTGLQRLLDTQLVEGFNVDSKSPKPDCIACTKAKQHVEPFPKSVEQMTGPGDLTHINLWGKYTVWSINGNQYYLLFMDNAQHYITVVFLKEKSDATMEVMNYLTHLTMQGHNPKVIQIDRGMEFVNEKLENWCKEHGIEIWATAPYSPSQNGTTE
jgi:IS30 family transposase